MYRELYAVVDRVTEDFNGPIITVRNRAEAERLFLTVISKPDTTVGQHPADHDLVYIGKVDITGYYDAQDKPLVKHATIIKGADWLAAQESKNNG